MDALPMPEDTDLDFASEIDGAMHACGHDAHTAMLASAARMLSRRRDELTGQVVFMFQPGEEGHHGAKVMLDEGLLDGRNVTRAFATHPPRRRPRVHGRVRHRPRLPGDGERRRCGHVGARRAGGLVGEFAAEMPTPVMGAEDWSYILQQVPGAMAFLGTCPPGVPLAEAAPNHSNRMIIDEGAMAVGTALYAAIALDGCGVGGARFHAMADLTIFHNSH